MRTEITVSFRKSFERLLYGRVNDGHKSIHDPTERLLQELRTVSNHVLDAVEAIGVEERIHIEGDFWDFLLFVELVRELFSVYAYSDTQTKILIRLQKAEEKMNRLCQKN